jgi:hypothetical protein
MVGVDMSGCQLRIMADDSGDDLWITALENDQDVHSIGAEMAEPEKWAALAQEGCEFGVCKKKCKCKGHQKLRDDNKSTNFGVAFGMEEYALAAKLKISKDNAGKKLARWRVVNAGVYKRLVESGEEAKLKFASRTMGGRRRLFDKPNWQRAAEIAATREMEDAKKANRLPRIHHLQNDRPRLLRDVRQHREGREELSNSGHRSRHCKGGDGPHVARTTKVWG